MDLKKCYFKANSTINVKNKENLSNLHNKSWASMDLKKCFEKANSTIINISVCLYFAQKVYCRI